MPRKIFPPTPRRKPKSKPAGVRASKPAPVVSSPDDELTPDLIQRMKERAKFLASDPQAFADDAIETILYHREHLAWLVDHPPVGRSAAAVRVRAILEYAALSERIIDYLRAAKGEDSGGEQASDGDEEETTLRLPVGKIPRRLQGER